MDEEAIPVLRVANAAAAVTWYQRLGFSLEWEHRFEPGFPAFVSMARGAARLFLSEHTGDARPDTLIYLRLSDLGRSRTSSAQPLSRCPGDRRSACVIWTATGSGSACHAADRPRSRAGRALS
jgi:hypothetical protein